MLALTCTSNNSRSSVEPPSPGPPVADPTEEPVVQATLLPASKDASVSCGTDHQLCPSSQGGEPTTCGLSPPEEPYKGSDEESGEGTDEDEDKPLARQKVGPEPTAATAKAADRRIAESQRRSLVVTADAVLGEMYSNLVTTATDVSNLEKVSGLITANKPVPPEGAEFRCDPSNELIGAKSRIGTYSPEGLIPGKEARGWAKNILHYALLMACMSGRGAIQLTLDDIQEFLAVLRGPVEQVALSIEHGAIEGKEIFQWALYARMMIKAYLTTGLKLGTLAGKSFEDPATSVDGPHTAALPTFTKCTRGELGGLYFAKMWRLAVKYMLRLVLADPDGFEFTIEPTDSDHIFDVSEEAYA